MRLARKLFLLAVTAVAALALTASAASAQLTVSEEHTAGNQACTAVNKVGHVVTGGCHIEVVSTEHIPLVAFVPQRVVLSNCNVHLEARINATGGGWVTAAVLTDEVPPASPPCTRAPCDEANGTFRPWPLQIVEHAAGDEEVEATFCLRLGNLFGGAPGDPGSQCEVHLEYTQTASHDIEIGHHPSGAELCEVSPSPPAMIGIENAHFTYEPVGEDRIEVVH